MSSSTNATRISQLGLSFTYFVIFLDGRGSACRRSRSTRVQKEQHAPAASLESTPLHRGRILLDRRAKSRRASFGPLSRCMIRSPMPWGIGSERIRVNTLGRREAFFSCLAPIALPRMSALLCAPLSNYLCVDHTDQTRSVWLVAQICLPSSCLYALVYFCMVRSTYYPTCPVLLCVFRLVVGSVIRLFDCSAMAKKIGGGGGGSRCGG